MSKRMPQPLIDPSRRDLEAHGFVAGSCIAALGLLLTIIGASHLTSAQTTEGGRARETDLVKAFAYGGITYIEPEAPPPPVPTGDPAVDAAALDRWERQLDQVVSGARKLRVDTGAKAACPT
jgi:hypothetical protein